MEATSTCEVGSEVTTFTLWGGQRVLGCKEMTEMGEMGEVR